MKPDRILIVLLALALGGTSLLHGQGVDDEISNLATNLANAIKAQTRKKVAVIDFSDLDGASSELGKYIAEQLTVDLVMVRHDFSVLDRGNLRKILAEHKLTATGLVDPDNAKKLGQFAGVDALILGTVTPKKPKVAVTAKIITTDTAEIVGAARAEFPMDTSIQELVSKPAADPKENNASGEEKAAVSKTFGDLRVDLQPLRIANGVEYELTMTLANQNTKHGIWVALDQPRNGYGPRGKIIDSTGSECFIDSQSLSGIQPGSQFLQYGNGSGYGTMEDLQHPHHRFDNPTELKPGNSSTAIIKFRAARGKRLEPGICTLQLSILLGRDFDIGAPEVDTENLVTKVQAN